MIPHEHTDPSTGKLHIVNLDNAAYVELERDSAHIRVVYGDGVEVILLCASAEKAKNEWVQIRRKMEGVG